jgi:hypothetical protein
MVAKYRKSNATSCNSVSAGGQAGGTAAKASRQASRQIEPSTLIMHSLLDLLSRLVVHIGVAPLDQAYRKVVQLVKVVAGIRDLAAPGKKAGKKGTSNKDRHFGDEPTAKGQGREARQSPGKQRGMHGQCKPAE